MRHFGLVFGGANGLDVKIDFLLGTGSELSVVIEATTSG